MTGKRTVNFRYGVKYTPLLSIFYVVEKPVLSGAEASFIMLFCYLSKTYNTVSDFDYAVVAEAAERSPEPNPNKKDIGFNININT